MLTAWLPEQVRDFLSDIATVTTDDSHVANNVGALDVGLVQAWHIVHIAKKSASLNYQKDYALLEQVSIMRSNSVLMGTLGGDQVLKNVMSKNVSAPCNTCQNNKPWLNKMDEYLKDVAYFVTTFGKNTGGNQSASVFSSGITSGNPGHVIGAMYMLKVLRKDPTLLPLGFEGTLNGPSANCEPDATGAGAKIYEFKSWSPNPSDTDIGSMGADENYSSLAGSSAFARFANNSYAGPPNSYTQFLCYLSNITTMNDLEYIFDKDLLQHRGQSNAAAYVKGIFRELLLKPQEQQQVFDVIWGNVPLRESLFPRTLYNNGNIGDEEYRAAAMSDFANRVANPANTFYNFIKPK